MPMIMIEAKRKSLRWSCVVQGIRNPHSIRFQSHQLSNPFHQTPSFTSHLRPCSIRQDGVLPQSCGLRHCGFRHPIACSHQPSRCDQQHQFPHHEVPVFDRASSVSDHSQWSSRCRWPGSTARKLYHRPPVSSRAPTNTHLIENHLRIRRHHHDRHGSFCHDARNAQSPARR